VNSTTSRRRVVKLLPCRFHASVRGRSLPPHDRIGADRRADLKSGAGPHSVLRLRQFARRGRDVRVTRPTFRMALEQASGRVLDVKGLLEHALARRQQSAARLAPPRLDAHRFEPPGPEHLGDAEPLGVARQH